MTEYRAQRFGTDAPHPRTPAAVVFDLLNSSERRYVLYCLTRHTGPVELRELADQLVTWEVTPIQDHDRIIASLYHSHLPKLEDAGVLTFDARQRLVALTDAATDLRPYLELAARDDLRTDALVPAPTWESE